MRLLDDSNEDNSLDEDENKEEDSGKEDDTSQADKEETDDICNTKAPKATKRE